MPFDDGVWAAEPEGRGKIEVQDSLSISTQKKTSKMQNVETKVMNDALGNLFTFVGKGKSWAVGGNIYDCRSCL